MTAGSWAHTQATPSLRKKRAPAFTAAGQGSSLSPSQAVGHRRRSPRTQWAEREWNDAVSMTWVQLETVIPSEVRKRKALPGSSPSWIQGIFRVMASVTEI